MKTGYKFTRRYSAPVNTPEARAGVLKQIDDIMECLLDIEESERFLSDADIAVDLGVGHIDISILVKVADEAVARQFAAKYTELAVTNAGIRINNPDDMGSTIPEHSFTDPVDERMISERVVLAA